MCQGPEAARTQCTQDLRGVRPGRPLWLNAGRQDGGSCRLFCRQLGGPWGEAPSDPGTCLAPQHLHEWGGRGVFRHLPGHRGHRDLPADWPKESHPQNSEKHPRPAHQQQGGEGSPPGVTLGSPHTEGPAGPTPAPSLSQYVVSCDDVRRLPNIVFTINNVIYRVPASAYIQVRGRPGGWRDSRGRGSERPPGGRPCHCRCCPAAQAGRAPPTAQAS